MPDNQLLKDLLKLALAEFYQQDGILLQDDLLGTERSCVFRIGIYLQELINSTPELEAYVLDSEYNKNVREPKILDDKKIRPDLILHKRLLDSESSDQQNNLLAIEFKGHWNHTRNDFEKLCNLTAEAHGYSYQLGAFVKLTPSKSDVEILFFAQGERIDI